MPYIHKMYSDESGYTGDDLLQPNQPFFVYSFLTLNKLGQEKDLKKELPLAIASIFTKDRPKRG